MTLTYQQENWNDCKEDMRPIWQIHWDELGQQGGLTFGVAEDNYERLAHNRALIVTTARFNGELVGYHYAILTHSLHSKNCLIAVVDVCYLHPDHRKGDNGLKLMRCAEGAIREAGAQKLFFSYKPSRDLSPILQRMGYGLEEVTYSKVLEGPWVTH